MRRSTVVAVVLAGASATLGLACTTLLGLGTPSLEAEGGTTEAGNGMETSPGMEAGVADAPREADAVADAGTDVLESGLSPDVICPSEAGPVSRTVPLNGTQFCIDTTEVTVGQYNEFLAALDGGKPTLPPMCTWKTTFAPSVQQSVANLPITYVDWCDAYVYCTWAGKHLCGVLGGGPASFATPDPSTEWVNACQVGGVGVQAQYPYGPTYDPTACNGSDYGANGVVPVGSLPKCQGAFPGIFDLSGNVGEWIDACDDAGAGNAASDDCLLIGGSFKHGSQDLTCLSVYQNIVRGQRGSDIGFRCCQN